MLRHAIIGRFEYIFSYNYFCLGRNGVIDISADDTTIRNKFYVNHSPNTPIHRDARGQAAGRRLGGGTGMAAA